MANPENLNNQEINKKSPDQLANQKFDEIYNKLRGDKKIGEPYDYGEEGLNIQKDGNIKGEILCNRSPNNGGTESIYILWNNGGINESMYKLSRINGKFSLTTSVGTGENRQKKVIDNLTPEELLDSVLPKFEKRINEGEIIKKQERAKAIEEANLLAFQKDQQDADRLLQENGLA